MYRDSLLKECSLEETPYWHILFILFLQNKKWKEI